MKSSQNYLASALTASSIILSPFSFAGSELALGMTTELIYTGEWVANLDGGIKQSSRYLNNLDLTLSIDTATANWWENGEVFAYVLAVGGGAATEVVGDMQATSNIESASALRLYEFWYRHQINENVGALIGLHDYNSVFDALDTAGLFFNSSFGISPDISQVGPSIFPETSLALVIDTTFGDNHYLNVAAYDGVPGNGKSEQGTHIRLDSEDGIFYAAELGTTGDNTPYKLAIGAWHKTTNFNDDITGKAHDNNSGVYAIGEYSFNDKLQGFVQLGHADSQRNVIDNYLGFGVNYQSPLATDDIFGVAFGYAQLSDDYQKAANSDAYEAVLEITYLYPINEWLAIQPDVQYVINPGADSTLDNATVFALRVEIAL